MVFLTYFFISNLNTRKFIAFLQRSEKSSQSENPFIFSRKVFRANRLERWIKKNEGLVLYRRSPKSQPTFSYGNLFFFLSFQVFFFVRNTFPADFFSAFALLLMVVVHFVPAGRFLSWKIVKRDCHFRATDFHLYTLAKVCVELLKCILSEESRF